MKYYLVDAFADKVFEGNPAGVCVLDSPISESLMQKIAAENNISVTAFAVKKSPGNYYIRWFKPEKEIGLCGHATLALAFVISNYYEPDIKTINCESASENFMILVDKNTFEMDFPAFELTSCKVTPLIEEVLGFKPREAVLGRDLILLVDSEQQVKNARPNFELMKKIPIGEGMHITASSDQYDFVSRCFFPKIGMQEDPVCGSAHCGLAAYWAKKLEKDELVARQHSQRGGTLYCRSKDGRVKIKGKAVLYSEAELYIQS
ncbi:PhzF family phenazine biosynthesis protein [Clostridiaceae bacterium M8S5]|nr:PhzF family phenazine biosynthesis protein [Clostridiaceae bacterium M8S5]